MRLHLTLALITVLALVLTLRSEKGHQFTFAQVEEMAQKRAAAKYVPMPDVLPPQLKKLTPEQDRGIFSKETARLWRKKGLPFQVDLYHQLNSYPKPHVAPEINTVDAKGSHQLPYSPTLFNFLNFAVNPPAPFVFDPLLPLNLGYAGFYVRYPDMGIGSNANSLDGFFSVLGGSYFRALAKEQVYGLSARGLAINTSVPGKPEEFPVFCEWWLQEPSANATELVLDALLDSPSVSGAYEFKIRPGAVTSVDVHASLFFRQPIEQLGIAPFSSMYLFGENAKDHFSDKIHPEIHDSDGVLMNTSRGEWIWRPLAQSNDPDAGPIKGFQLQLYNFLDENPKGFGLIQRDRNFQHYQDLQTKYNVRPSAWVTPHGNWGKGAVELIQRPSNDFNTDNVVLFWHPEQTIKAGDHPASLDYTIDFYMNDAARPPMAYTKQTLVNCPAPPPPPPPLPPAPIPTPTAAKPGVAAPPIETPAKAYASQGPMGPPKPVAGPPPPPTGTIPVQFLVDFAGNGIELIPPNQPPSPVVICNPPGTYLRETSVEKNGYDNSWRVTFTIIPAKRNVPTELRCLLTQNNKPITETWTYTWNQ